MIDSLMTGSLPPSRYVSRALWLPDAIESTIDCYAAQIMRDVKV